MGGVIVLDYCLRKPQHISGVILSSPAIGKLGISPMLIQIAKLLNKVWPSMSTSTGLDISKLTHDTEFVNYTKTDPLYHRKATPRFGMEVQRTVDFIQKNANSFSIPSFLIHGTDDQIVSIEGSRQLVKNTTNPHLIYKEYKNGYHELFNDTMKQEVIKDIIDWIKGHIHKS
jgi:alpha-beta hydrolase superfamily lysophospholipase